MLLLFKKLMCPDIPGGPAPTSSITKAPISSSMNKEDVIDFLSSDDDKDVLDIEEKAKKEGKKPDKIVSELPDTEDDDDDDKSDDDEDELSEIEDELKQPTEEQLELVTPVRRREILKKYPTLFKDFPYLEKAYYREQQFTELLPTIQDARDAVEKSQVLDRFEADVIQGGNLTNILQAVKGENPEAFLKIADNYLPTLAAVDNQAYLHVLGNVSKHTIIAMVQESKRSNNEPLRLAAQILNQFVFGSSDFTPPSALAKGVKNDGKPDPTQQREQEFVKRQFDTTLGDLNTKVTNTLRNTIEANIDPRESMTDYVRKKSSDDALAQLDELMNQDQRFKTLVDKLWAKAFEDNFSKESTDRIKSAHLAKAKSLLPAVIKKARNEALRGMGKRVKEDDSTESHERKGPITPGRPSSHRSDGKSSKGKDGKEIPKGMTTLEFLNSD